MLDPDRTLVQPEESGRTQQSATPNYYREHTFASWEDYKSGHARILFGSDLFRRGRFLFRGHSEPTWKLASSFDRLFASEEPRRRQAIAKSIIASFRQTLDDLAVPDEIKNDDALMLALGQHHGLPTRLLDWTESPYVAAFFAFSPATFLKANDSQIVIWALDRRSPIWYPVDGIGVIDLPSIGNLRLRNQAGKFTRAQAPVATIEEYIEKHKDSSNALTRLLVPRSEAMKAMADLDAMGIHHGTVFPELEGAARLALFRAIVEHDVRFVA